MEGKRIADELDRFDPELPLESAWTPPASWYREPALGELERRTTFRRSWQVVARIEQLDAPGRYVTGEFAGEPWVIVHGRDGELRGFFNVCRHHGTVVAPSGPDAPACLEQLVCPYHGWTYDLDGSLRSAPHLGAVRDFDRGEFGLIPIAVAVWGPWVWACIEPGERTPSDDLAPLAERLAPTGWEALRFVERRSWEIDCNWKVYVDNYLDGGYHVAHLHRGLAAQLDLGSYRTEVFEHFSIQSGRGAEPHDAVDSANDSGDFRERIGESALYAWIHPNFMINRYGPLMDTNLVLPLGAERCQTVFEYWVEPDLAGDAEFLERSLEASDRVQREDVEICEKVQRGLASSAYERGRYSALREEGALHFHRLLAGELRAGAETSGAGFRP